MVTHEGGTIPEENLTNYNVDRVKTLGEAVLGLTLGCAQCHDHKYDPITQRDYYQLFAYFNTLSDMGLDGNGGVNPRPFVEAKTVLPTDEVPAACEQQIAATRRRSSHIRPTRRVAAWEDEQRSDAGAVAAETSQLHPVELLEGQHAQRRRRVRHRGRARFVTITRAAGPGGVRRVDAAAGDRTSRSPACASCFIPTRDAPGGGWGFGTLPQDCARRTSRRIATTAQQGHVRAHVVLGQRRERAGRPGQSATGCSPCGA